VEGGEHAGALKRRQSDLTLDVQGIPDRDHARILTRRGGAALGFRGRGGGSGGTQMQVAIDAQNTGRVRKLQDPHEAEPDGS